MLTSTVDDTGFDSLADAIESHRTYLLDRGLLDSRQQRIARSELKRAIGRRIRLDAPDTAELVDSLVAEMSRRTLTPDAAAVTVLRTMVQQLDER